MFNQKEYSKQYYIKNKEKLKEYRRNNLERVRESENKYYKKNTNKVLLKNKRWVLRNTEKVNEYKKKWKKNNPEKSYDSNKLYYKKNSMKIKKRNNNRNRTNLKYNLNRRMGTAIRTSLNGNKSGYHWETLVGYSVNDLIKRLKKTMPKGYTWQDLFNGKLHIDHIIPMSAHNYTESKHADFIKCWALSNLQLLPARDNIRKSNKLSKPFQPALNI